MKKALSVLLTIILVVVLTSTALAGGHHGGGHHSGKGTKQANPQAKTTCPYREDCLSTGICQAPNGACSNGDACCVSAQLCPIGSNRQPNNGSSSRGGRHGR